jgi:hypothetical protein
MAAWRLVLLLAALAAASGGCAGDDATTQSAPAAVPPSQPRLFLAGDGQLAIVDIESATARLIQLPQLAAGDPPYRIIRRDGNLVFYGGDTYAFAFDLRSAPRKIGDSWFFIPSAREDRVWLATLDPASAESVRALRAVREVTVAGEVTTAAARPAGGRWPVAAVSDGLLFERRAGGLDLWDPSRGRVIRTLPQAAAGPTRDNLLAWCDAAGRLHLTDVGSGAEQALVAPPEGFAAFACRQGEFGPDGRLLAVPLSVRPGSARPRR